MTSALVSGSTIQFLQINGTDCQSPVAVNGKTTGNIQSALIKVIGGFKYADNQLYDMYIKLTNIQGASTWKASIGNFISLNPSSDTTNTAGYDYEVWLIASGKANTLENRATFLFEGGSCYMAGKTHGSPEYCRPWSTDNNIYVSYTTAPGKALTYYSNGTVNGWSYQGRDEYNRGDTVVYGKGSSVEHSIKGGYTVIPTGGWGAEMVFGYVVNNYSVTFTDGTISQAVSNIPEGEIVQKIPTSLQKNGKHIKGGKASTALILDDGTTIAANTFISTEQLSKVIEYNSNFTLTLEYEDHNVSSVNGQAATCTVDGWSDYYQCSYTSCNKYYKEASCTNEITDLEAWKATDGQGKIVKLGHDWGYTANSATLTASCSRNATCGQADITLTLTATSQTYSGSPVSASFGSGQETAWKTALGNANLPSIHYVGRDGTTYGDTTTAPTAVGKYTASISPVGETASPSNTAKIDFEIKKINGYLQLLPGAKNLKYNGAKHKLLPY